MKIAIIGLGIVGSAQARRFADHELVTYDPRFNKRYPKRKINQCTAAIICVGTPEARDGRADISMVEEAVERLPGDMSVLIRSTVPPGTTDRLAAGRIGLTAFCPEYMHEREGGAWKESADVPWLVLGGHPVATEWFAATLFHSGCDIEIHETTAPVAEFSKYVGNTFNAVKVGYVNECAKVAEAQGLDWEAVAAAWRSDPRVDATYTKMEGFPPGFGGRCLPKDLAALIQFAIRSGYAPDLLIELERSNQKWGGEISDRPRLSPAALARREARIRGERP